MANRNGRPTYVALGAGLRAAGHQVTLATHAGYEAFASQHDLHFHLVTGDWRRIMEGEAGQVWLESGRNPFTSCAV